MKRKVVFLLCAVAATLVASAKPTITDMQVAESGSRIVTITYKLTDEPAVVTLDIQTNDVATGAWASIGGENIAPSLTGAVNRYVEASNTWVNVIFWRPSEAWPGHLFENGTAKAVLTAWPTNAPPTFMVVDLTNAATRVAYYPDKASVPGGITNDMYKTDKIILRKIPAAGITWQMGSPADDVARSSSETLHDVKLTQDYYMACYETTRGYWDNVEAYSQKVLKGGLYVCARSPYDSDGTFTKEELRRQALGRVTYAEMRGWNDAKDKYNWPSNGHDVISYSFFGVLRLMTGNGILFDLPTEAQWEFAARGMTATQAYFGTPYTGTTAKRIVDTELLSKYAWTEDTASIAQLVGQKEPNVFDLYDVIGNVYETCLDQWQADLGSASSEDPKGVDTNPDQRVYRGYGFVHGMGFRAISAQRYKNVTWNEMWGNIGQGCRIWAPAVAVKQQQGQ